MKGFSEEQHPGKEKESSERSSKSKEQPKGSRREKLGTQTKGPPDRMADNKRNRGGRKKKDRGKEGGKEVLSHALDVTVLCLFVKTNLLSLALLASGMFNFSHPTNFYSPVLVAEYSQSICELQFYSYMNIDTLTLPEISICI